MHVRVCVVMHACICICACVLVHACLCMSSGASFFIYVCMCCGACMCVCGQWYDAILSVLVHGCMCEFWCMHACVRVLVHFSFCLYAYTESNILDTVLALVFCRMRIVQCVDHSPRIET